MSKRPSKAPATIQWLQERFPMVNFLSGLIMYLMIAGVSKSFSLDSILENGEFHLLSGLVLTSLFLLLRVIDEHKDFETDLHNHPDRVLQSGKISLKKLKVVGAFCLMLQIGYALWIDQGFGMTFACYLLVLLWAFLMAKEFFVGPWLKRYLLLYALSHMLIAPLSVIWILAALKKTTLEPGIGWLITLPFMAGMVYEIARKLRGAEEERPTVDSYSQALGHHKAAALLAYFSIAALANYILLIEKVFIDPHWVNFVLAGFSFLLLSTMIIQYYIQNTQKSRKALEAVAGLFILVLYSTLIFESFR